MDVEQRADTCHLHRRAPLGGDLAETLSQRIAQGVDAHRRLGGEHLGQPREPAGHGEDIVVERPGMGNRIRPVGIEMRHHLALAAEGAEAGAAAEIFPEGGHVRGDAQPALQPRRREPGSHHLVEDEDDAERRAFLAQHLEEFRRAGDAAAAALHGLHDDGRQLLGMAAHQRAGPLDVVVGADQPVDGEVELVMAGAEIEDAAVIGVLEGHDARSLAVEGAQRREGHQIGLGAGIGEADQLDRREAGTDRRCKPRLVLVRAAQHRALVDGLLLRRLDHRFGMAVEPGGVFAEEIDIFHAVDIGQPVALAPRPDQGKGREMQHGAGIAARHMLGGLLLPRRALGVAGAIMGLGLLQRLIEIGIGQMSCGLAGLDIGHGLTGSMERR